MPQDFAGGIARYIDNFARVAGAVGHSVTIIARTSENIDTIIAPGVRLIGFVPRSILLNEPIQAPQPDAHPAYPYNILGYWPGLSYELAEYVLSLAQDLPPPDIIESQEYGALPYYLIQRRLTERTHIAQVPIVVQLHSASYDLRRINHEPSYRFPEYWVGQMEKFCIRAADAVLSPSRFLAKHTQQILGLDLDIATIPYPMLLPHSPGIVHPTPNDLVYVGRLEVRKGILPMLDACSHMWEQGASLQLTLIGGDTLFRPRGIRMSEYIQRRYHRWIQAGLLHIPGSMPQSDLLQRIRSAWAVIVPSLWENFPNTCIEAMGMGQIVLASRNGGQAEMITENGQDGFLFDWNKPGDFEQNLQHILALDPTERASIADRARTRIEHFCDPQRVLEQRIDHFADVISRHQQSRVFPSLLENTLAPITAASGEQPELLSVVIPFYNLGDYIGETVASVLNSSYRPLEVVIVDDGSTESAGLAKLKELEQAEVRIVRVSNNGLANARNVGAEAARGEFVAFLDADDTIEPDYYIRAIDVLRRYNNVAFVYSWVRWFETTDHIWPAWNVEFPYLLGHNMLAAFVVMPRARFLQAARNKPEVAYSLEDFEAWITLVEAGGVGVSLPFPLVNYRIRRGSMFRESQQDQQLYLYETIADLHPELYQRWGKELFSLQNANGSAMDWNHPALERSDHRTSTSEFQQTQHSYNQLWEEAQRLAKAWQDQKNYIDAQAKYIGDLEQRCNDLLHVVGSIQPPEPSNNGIIGVGDYLLGGRIIYGIRRQPIVHFMLRINFVKRFAKRLLRR